MPSRLWNVSKRLTLVGLAVAAVTALSGCVVAPAYPARYGYGHGYGYYDGAPAVVRTPPPPPRYYPYYRYRGW